MPTAEAGLRRRVMDAVHRHWSRQTGVLLFGRPASATTGPGHPDLLAVCRGRFLGMELKKIGGRITPIQRRRIMDLREAGAHAWVVRSVPQALFAIAWTLEEGRVPMADEPLDINDWLTSANGTASEPAPADDVPVEAMKAAVQEAQTRLPTIQEAVAVSAQWRAEGAQLEQTGFDTDLDRLRNDVRAVGDRVTLLYERFESVIAGTATNVIALERLLELVDPDWPGSIAAFVQARAEREAEKLHAPAEPEPEAPPETKPTGRGRRKPQT